MIYYKEEKKKLVIPSGFVMIPIDCDEAIEQAREDGYREGFADGSSATCDTEEGTYSLTDDFDGEETVFPSEGKTGFNKIVIVDNGYGDAKYDEGYADGLADCSGSTPCDCSSAVTEAYQSGITEGIAQQKALLTSTAITSNGTYTSENGWNSLTVDVPAPPIIRVEKRFNLESGDTSPWTVRPDWTTYMTDVIITDNGYGQGKYDEGYAEGYLSGASTTDCSSAITEAYQSGYTAGLNDCSGSTCELESIGYGVSDGWNGNSSISINDPGVTANGWSAVTVFDNGYGDWKYNSGFTAGYEQGLNDCSGGTCNLEMKNYEIYASGEGVWLVEPDNGYDGISHLTIYDAGYGGKWYDTGLQEGFNNGYTSGYTDGHSSGYTEGYGAGYTSGSADGYNVGEQYGFQTGYQSGYTDGYNDAITANCGSAVTEAYESGVTEERGNIYAVKIKVTPTSQNWSWTQFGTPHKLTAADALGNNYVFNINYVIYDGYSWDEDAGQTHIDYEFLGRFETTGGTPVKYLTPAQLTIEVPSQDYNTWGSNIGIEVFFNGEMIPAQYEGETLPPYIFDLENGFKYATTSYSVGYNADDSRCYQLIINL